MCIAMLQRRGWDAIVRDLIKTILQYSVYFFLAMYLFWMVWRP